MLFFVDCYSCCSLTIVIHVVLWQCSIEEQRRRQEESLRRAEAAMQPQVGGGGSWILLSFHICAGKCILYDIPLVLFVFPLACIIINTLIGPNRVGTSTRQTERRHVLGHCPGRGRVCRFLMLWFPCPLNPPPPQNTCVWSGCTRRYPELGQATPPQNQRLNRSVRAY